MMYSALCKRIMSQPIIYICGRTIETDKWRTTIILRANEKKIGRIKNKNGQIKSSSSK